MKDSLNPAVVPFGKSKDEAKVFELAQLSPFEYEKCRQTEAKKMCVRVPVLDKQVALQRPSEEETENVSAKVCHGSGGIVLLRAE